MLKPILSKNFILKMNLPRSLSVSVIRHCSGKWLPQEIETHTGQKWNEDDYRLVRFIDKKKHVNPNWAIKLVQEIPPKACTERVVACDGGGGPTGHPKIFINLDRPGSHSCTYCGLRFFLDHHH